MSFICKFAFLGCKKGFSKREAFTLAEVLTTLMVIGIVAALTIPSMMNSYKKHTYVVGLKKAYSQLSQAVKMIFVDTDCPEGDFACTGLFENIAVTTNMLASKFKTTQTRPVSGCGPSSNTRNCFITTDGMAFSVTKVGDYEGGYGIAVSVDVNGEKIPNKTGRDVFLFYLFPDISKEKIRGKIIADGSHEYADYIGNTGGYWKTNLNNPNSNMTCAPNNLNAACTGRVLEEGKMNY